MSDALVSPPVFAVTGALSLALLGVAVRRVKRAVDDCTQPDGYGERLVALMGVMGAFVFAAQLINFAIPGTGSSGHLVGGILLAALLGPWAGLLTLSSVLVIQCLVFADGGLMALGANILNMAACSCLVAYPLLFRPLMRRDASAGRIAAASLLASVAGLGLGALAVTVETEASGITALPMGRFLLFMLPIHLFIGIGEGLATAAVLCTVRRYRPELLCSVCGADAPAGRRWGGTVAAIALAALFVGGSFSWIASSDPDGLEWSIERTAGRTEVEPSDDGLHRRAATVQRRTAALPDYDTSFAGIVGSGAVLLAVLGTSRLLRAGRRRG